MPLTIKSLLLEVINLALPIQVAIFQILLISVEPMHPLFEKITQESTRYFWWKLSKDKMTRPGTPWRWEKMKDVLTIIHHPISILKEDILQIPGTSLFNSKCFLDEWNYLLLRKKTTQKSNADYSTTIKKLICNGSQNFLSRTEVSFFFCADKFNLIRW